MSTLATHIARLPYDLRAKFDDTKWVDFANEILEILSGERLLPELTYQKGVIVKYHKWITPPSNFRFAKKIFDPLSFDTEYKFVESDGKLMLTDNKIDEEESPSAATAFTLSTVDSVTVNIDDLEEDELKDYLMVITGGTKINDTYVIAKNDASVGGVTKVYYLHQLASALTITGTPQLSAANFIHPDYYLMLSYKGSFVDLTLSSEEVPMNNNHERTIMKTGLMMIGYEMKYGEGSEQFLRAEASFKKAMMALRDEFFAGGARTNIRPRPMAGLSVFDLDNADEEKEEDED